MQSNILSNQIHVFPLAKNRPADREARLFYEDNVANLTRQLIDTDGFIISPNKNASDILKLNSNNDIVNGEHPLCFNIYGYYFEIEKNTVLVECGNYINEDSTIPMGDKFTLYAKIKIDPTTREIIGQDESDTASSKYMGLSITNESPKDGEAGLALFNCELGLEGSSRTISASFVESSFNKLSPTSISVYKIDGKRPL